MAKTRRRSLRGKSRYGKTRRYKKTTHRSVKQKGGIFGQSTPRPEKIAKIDKWLKADDTLCSDIKFPQSCATNCKKLESPTTGYKNVGLLDEHVYSMFNDFRTTNRRNPAYNSEEEPEEDIYENIGNNPLYENLPSLNAVMNTRLPNDPIYMTVPKKAERKKGMTKRSIIVRDGYEIPYEDGGSKRKTRRRRANKRRGRKNKTILNKKT